MRARFRKHISSKHHALRCKAYDYPILSTKLGHAFLDTVCGNVAFHDGVGYGPDGIVVADFGVTVQRHVVCGIGAGVDAEGEAIIPRQVDVLGTLLGGRDVQLAA